MRWIVLLALLAVACSSPSNSDGGPSSAADASQLDGGGLPDGSASPDGGVEPPDASMTSDGGVTEVCVPMGEATANGDLPLTITADAIYCASFNEGRTLPEEYDRKALLRFAPGSHQLNTQSGTHAFSLPLCVQFREPGAAPAPSATGTLTTTSTPFGDGRHVSMRYEQPMQTAGGEAWVLDAQITLRVPDTGGASVTLDGTHPNPFGEGVHVSWALCRETCTAFIDYRDLNSCHFRTEPLQRHTITFTGGSIELDLRIGESVASTEPGIFVASRGELDGEAFEQQDYWMLIYNPEHHHFERHFIVLFDMPRADGTCGIQVTGASPYPESPPATVELVDCDLRVRESRMNISQSFTRE